MSKKWETITFDQIKKGDRLKATRTVDDMIIAYCGTANHMNDGTSWVTKCGWFIAGQGYKIKRRIVKPPKPEPLPTKPGSVILVSELLATNPEKTATFDPPQPFHLVPTNTWLPVGNGDRWGYHPSRITKWEHASVIPTAILYM